MKYHNLIFILLFISNTIFAQSSWTLSNNGIPNKFNAYDFIVGSSSEIYAVGSLFDGSTVTPKIYKSTDSGNNWSELSVTGMSSHNYLYSASCIAGNKMFINASSNSATYAIYKSITSNTSIINMLDNFHFSIYPNPASDYITIKSQEKIDIIKIFNMNGELLKLSTDCNVFIGDLPHSVYFINIIYNNNTTQTKKIIIQ